MTVRTYGQLSYTVAVLGAAEVMRGQPDPSRLVAATGRARAFKRGAAIM